MFDTIISSTSFWMIIATCFIYIVYRYFNKSKDWWEIQGVPSFKASIKDWFLLYKKPSYFLDLEKKLYSKFGRVYGRYDGLVPVLTVGDPDLLRNILVKDFSVFQNRRDAQFGDPVIDNNVSLLSGHDWKRVRNIITPTFTSGKLRKMLPKINECSDFLIDSLKTASKRGTTVDAEKLLGSFVLDVIASCAFGIKLHSLENPDNPFVIHAKGFFAPSALRSILSGCYPFIMKLFKISMLNPSSTKFFGDFALKIVEERQKHQEKGTDYLQHLVDTGESEGNMNDQPSEGEELKKTTKTLSHDEIVAQCVVFFLAGFDTVTSLLQFLIYNVAHDATIQDRLVKEISDTLGDKKTLEYEDFMNMNYLNCVVSEALRLSTGCIRMDRRAEEDYQLGDILIKKGQLVSIPIYAIHHDSEWYPNPDVFDPERFSQEAKEARHPFVYLPFGIGPRNCVANRFALMEAKFIITKILRQFKVTLSPEQKVPLGFRVRQGVLSTSQLFINVEERKQM